MKGKKQEVRRATKQVNINLCDEMKKQHNKENIQKQEINRIVKIEIQFPKSSQPKRFIKEERIQEQRRKRKQEGHRRT